MFYNKKTHSGWLVAQLKVRRRTKKTNKTSSDTSSDDEKDENDDVQETVYTEENAREDCTFLRRAVVNPSTRAKIEEKLIATAAYRKTISMDSENSLLKCFPFFFHTFGISKSQITDTDTITFDLTLQI